MTPAEEVMEALSWLPIATAPIDGTIVKVYAAECEDLPAFTCLCCYTEWGGWLVDELRQVTHWQPAPEEDLILARLLAHGPSITSAVVGLES